MTKKRLLQQIFISWNENLFQHKINRIRVFDVEISECRGGATISLLGNNYICWCFEERCAWLYERTIFVE